VDGAACSYQGEEAALDEARLEPDCDEDSAEVEQIEEESHFAVLPGTGGNLELTADWVAVERAVVEETLEPCRTGVAERWSTVGEALQAEHIASVKRMWAAEEWARWCDEQQRVHG
jgi:hypothetical protein